MLQARHNLTDRAYRYRANRKAPPGEKRCAFCGIKRNASIEVGHIDGREENDSPENLIWTCRSCNVLAANTLRKHRMGRLTHQYNPAEGAKTLGQWLTAVTSMKGENTAMSVRDAVAMIRATSPAKRSRFASDIWDRRRARGNPTWTGRRMTQAERDAAYAEEDREHEAAEKHREWVREQQRQRLKKNPRGTKGRFARCVKAVSKRGGATDPRAVCGAQEKKYRGKSAKSNPAAASLQAYEEFHGRPPDELIEVKEQIHHHKYLPSAGKLRMLKVEAIDGKHLVTLSRFGNAMLCFNERMNQLFVKNGDQSVDLAAFGIREEHEVHTLGKVTHVDYFTTKDHLGSDGGTAIYRHKFRTVNEDGEVITVKIYRCPDLIYYALDKRLVFSGGSYQILREGIDR